MKILLAEDDKNLGRLLQNLLKKENIKTDWVEDGEAAYEQCYRDGYDVLILDWMMPKLDGIALCKRLRAEEYQGKILLLTARDSVEDKVAGLNDGADDYLVKPFEMAELLARLHALVRRQGSYKQEDYVCKGVTLAVKDYTVGYKNKKIQLRPREFKLMELVWGIDGDVTENNLDVHIRSLRLKLASIGAESLIKTVRGVGYMLEVEDV